MPQKQRTVTDMLVRAEVAMTCLQETRFSSPEARWLGGCAASAWTCRPW